jgi:hypothetical protein
MKELIEIQSELKAPKSQFNSFGNYKYRNQEDILEALKPLLKKQGCYLTISDDIIEVGGRVYVKATACITKDDKSVCNSAFAREPLTQKGMNEAQITGSASSYARKYALNGLFCIDDTKDADITKPEDNESDAENIKIQGYIKKVDKEMSHDRLAKLHNMISDIKDDQYRKDRLSQFKWQLKEIGSSYKLGE